MNIPKQLHNFLRAEIDPAFSIRARLIFQGITSSRPQRVLDMGCGRGFYSHALTFFPFIKKIHSVDINESYLEVARVHCTDPRITLHKASIYTLPFPDNYFDCIVFSEVLEHVGNEKKALAELRRVLKEDGTLLITVPNHNFPFLWDPINWLLMKLLHTHIDKNIWWLAGIWADHNRLYSEEDITRVLRKNGFSWQKKPVKIVHWSWPFAHFVLYGIGKNIVERLPFGKGFSRFAFKKPGIFALLLSRYMEIPSRYLDRILPLSSSVNLFIEVKKS